MLRTTRHRAGAVALSLALAVGGWSCDEGPARTAERHAEGASRNPLAGRPLYVDPGSVAAQQADRWRAEGRADDAAAMARLAVQPTATWLSGAGDAVSQVRPVMREAGRAGATALLVAYHVPGRDCGSYSAGGAAAAASYRRWIRAVAREIGDGPAIVILEPDAVAQGVSGCLRGAARAARYALLRDAVRTLAARPHTSVYLDAGNAGWVRPVARLVRPLRAAGVGRADGFALNVSNFYDTPATSRYGRALSRRLGGAHFVIDTSRNGNGPLRSGAGGAPRWCNPPGRALGRVPTTRTGDPLADAYLWIKAPGRSDGACRRGAPPAGQWWPEYALELVRNGAGAGSLAGFLRAP
jgi:endoglucanase